MPELDFPVTVSNHGTRFTILRIIRNHNITITKSGMDALLKIRKDNNKWRDHYGKVSG